MDNDTLKYKQKGQRRLKMAMKSKKNRVRGTRGGGEGIG
jgi:hypothetical protein